MDQKQERQRLQAGGAVDRVVSAAIALQSAFERGDTPDRLIQFGNDCEKWARLFNEDARSEVFGRAVEDGARGVKSAAEMATQLRPPRSDEGKAA